MPEFMVKVKVNGEPGWSGSPLKVLAVDSIEAEKKAKRIHAERTNTNIGNIDAKAYYMRWGAVWQRPKGKVTHV